MQALEDLVGNGRLVAASGLFADGVNPEAIRLTFEQATWLVAVDADTDDILVSPQANDVSPLADLCEHDLPSFADWVGQRVTWAWLLLNNLDHNDGLQIQFEHGDAVQFMTGASALRTYALAPLK